MVTFLFSFDFVFFFYGTMCLFRICDRQRDVDRDEDRGEDEDEDANPLGKWPHALSPALACLSCTLGLFNISRFSILSVQFGGECRNCYYISTCINYYSILSIIIASLIVFFFQQISLYSS